jgi:hypothetical protein
MYENGDAAKVSRDGTNTQSCAKEQRAHDISNENVAVRKRRRGSLKLSIFLTPRTLSSNPGFEDDAPSGSDRSCEA